PLFIFFAFAFVAAAIRLRRPPLNLLLLSYRPAFFLARTAIQHSQKSRRKTLNRSVNPPCKTSNRRHPEPWRVLGGKVKDLSYFFAFAFAIRLRRALLLGQELPGAHSDLIISRHGFASPHNVLNSSSGTNPTDR